jgi:hypothetical protein
MNDERFFDLAMKVIARQATDAERAELDALLASQPELKSEFERLQTDVRIAREALPLVDATGAAAGELPAYARGRLQTKVRQTLGRPAAKKEPDRSLAWGWRLVFGLAAATAAVVVFVIPMFRTPNEPVIQLAMLDTAGATRGSETNEVILLQQTWTKATMDSFSEPELLRAWETNWPGNPKAVKIIYDPAAAEVRLLGRFKAEEFSKTFTVQNNLADTLKEAKVYLAERMKHPRLIEH